MLNYPIRKYSVDSDHIVYYEWLFRELECGELIHTTEMNMGIHCIYFEWCHMELVCAWASMLKE